MTERQLRNVGILALIGCVLVFTGLAMISLPTALVASGLVFVLLAVLTARTRPTE